MIEEACVLYVVLQVTITSKCTRVCISTNCIELEAENEAEDEVLAEIEHALQVLYSPRSIRCGRRPQCGRCRRAR